MNKIQDQIDRLITLISAISHIDEKQVTDYVYGEKSSNKIKKITNDKRQDTI